jgi:hypothetical protein
VRALAAVLEPITSDCIHLACDFQSMAAAGVIYAAQEIEHGSETSYVEQEFSRLRDFVLRVAENGDGLLARWG